MQVAKLIVRYAHDVSSTISINEKELVLLSEIGLTEIPAATNFVEYIAEKYDVSASGIWYTLKKLKRWGLLDFTERWEDYRPLALTELGVRMLRSRKMEQSRDRRQYKELINIGTPA